MSHVANLPIYLFAQLAIAQDPPDYPQNDPSFPPIEDLKPKIFAHIDAVHADPDFLLEKTQAQFDQLKEDLFFYAFSIAGSRFTPPQSYHSVSYLLIQHSPEMKLTSGPDQTTKIEHLRNKIKTTLLNRSILQHSFSYFIDTINDLAFDIMKTAIYCPNRGRINQEIIQGNEDTKAFLETQDACKVS